VKQATGTGRSKPYSEISTGRDRGIQRDFEELQHHHDAFRGVADPRILVVDDEEEVLNLLSSLLSNEGYQVEVALNGYDALMLVKKEHFHIILTDIKMRGMDGITLIREVQKIDGDTDVIVMTGYASVETAVETMKLGAADYVTKPFNIDHILITLAKNLERQRLLQLAREREYYLELSRKDGLTDLYNRRYFAQILDNEIARAQRYDHPLSLLFLDIDHFKTYNDTMGHPLADLALKKLAWILKNSCRHCDFIVRYGGEEFAILLMETDKNGAGIVAERVLENIRNTAFDGAGSMPDGRLTVSIGVASLPDDGRTAKELITASDRALYSAKKAGRNCVKLFRKRTRKRGHTSS
jgi:diguanylate cyclase (GGDEF)-like protein